VPPVGVHFDRVDDELDVELVKAKDDKPDAHPLVPSHDKLRVGRHVEEGTADQGHDGEPGAQARQLAAHEYCAGRKGGVLTGQTWAQRDVTCQGHLLQSAIEMMTGVAARKTMKVSTLAYCSVLILANIEARNATATGVKETSLRHSSASTVMRPQRPNALTATHEQTTCESRTKDGAGR